MFNYKRCENDASLKDIVLVFSYTKALPKAINISKMMQGSNKLNS